MDRQVEDLEDGVVAGDCNFDLLKENASISRYKDMFSSNGFHFLNRISSLAYTYPIQGPGAPGSIVDHFVSDMLSRPFNISLTESSLSEHRALVLSLGNVEIVTENVPRSYFDLQQSVQNLRNAIDSLQNPNLMDLHRLVSNAVSTKIHREGHCLARKLPWVGHEILSEMSYRESLNASRRQQGKS